MTTNLRDAKSRLSELVRRAAAGEEILITVRGKPTVRLSAIQSVGVIKGQTISKFRLEIFAAHTIIHP